MGRLEVRWVPATGAAAVDWVVALLDVAHERRQRARVRNGAGRVGAQDRVTR